MTEPPNRATGGFQELARRLVPGVVEEAVSEAREVARKQVVDELARAIVSAAREVAQAPSPSATAARTPASRPDVAGHRLDEHELDEDELDEQRLAEHRMARNGLADHGLYAYGVVSPNLSTADLHGLGGQEPIRTVRHGDLALAVSDIELSLLEGVEEDLSETGRLARLAKQHDQVLRNLLDRGSVLPLRFGTVLADGEDAYNVLADPDGSLRELLADLQGSREWGFRVDAPVGVAAENDKSPVHQPAVQSSESGTSQTGTAYLVGRRAALGAEEERRTQLAAQLDDVCRELAAHSRAVTTRGAGRGGRLSDDAYLVSVTAEDAFLAAASRAVEELDSAGCTAEVTGPWPPYSFVPVTLSGDRTPSGDRTRSGDRND